MTDKYTYCCWFTHEIHTIVRPGVGRSQQPKIPSRCFVDLQGSQHLSLHLSPLKMCTAGNWIVSRFRIGFQPPHGVWSSSMEASPNGPENPFYFIKLNKQKSHFTYFLCLLQFQRQMCCWFLLDYMQGNTQAENNSLSIYSLMCQ